ncbi:porin [Bacteroides coprosuis]|uniref:porin n=1 Tax=Bacteroides coprosuis TaxID=151276 RepID=UPI001D9648F2|nr:porin [Bacteroides coprosuis]HJD92393.1 OprO/OprP family phosphate-selective porin [Bacteroides coprosuis]
MKNIYLGVALFALFFPCSILLGKDLDRTNTQLMVKEKTLFEEVSGLKKKTDKLNLFFDIHSSADAYFNKGFDRGCFSMREFRVEARGELNSWLSYRYRQKLNRSNDASGQLDNMPNSIDVAYLSFKLSKKLSITTGKLFAAYGGIEFDLNPINVYEYSDIIDNMIGFMSGVTLGYQFTPTQELNLQITNNRNSMSVEELYKVDVEDAKLPLAYTLNWNGNFSDYYNPRWSFTYMNEAKSKNLYFLSLGNKFKLNNFGGYFDFMYSKEELDQKNIITSILNYNKDETAGFQNVGARYLSFILEFNYRVKEKWNVFIKGSYETASSNDACYSGDQLLKKGKYRSTCGYSTGLEFYPMNESNLHLFLTYVGKSYRYTDSAKSMGHENLDQSRVSLGFIYHLPLF